VPTENVHLLRNFTDAWNRGDLARCIALVSSDWEYRTTEFFPGMDPVYRGEDGFTKFWTAFRGAWESFTVEFKRVEDRRDVVLALQMFHGKGKGSGIEVSQRFACTYAFRDGLVVRMVSYGDDWEAALEAVGLTETSRPQRHA
jgi:ketosteroid isomerase-like protein